MKRQILALHQSPKVQLEETHKVSSLALLKYVVLIISFRNNRYALRLVHYKITRTIPISGDTSVANTDTCIPNGYTLELLLRFCEYKRKKSVFRILLILKSSCVSMELLEKILYTLVRWHESSLANHTTDLPCSARVSFISWPMCILNNTGRPLPRFRTNKKDVGSVLLILQFGL